MTLMSAYSTWERILRVSSYPSIRGIFMSVNGMVLRTGQTLGPLVMAGVFAWGGMDRVFFAATLICLVMFLALPGIIGRGRKEGVVSQP